MKVLQQNEKTAKEKHTGFLLRDIQNPTGHAQNPVKTKI
jgi:hypothetical protein